MNNFIKRIFYCMLTCFLMMTGCSKYNYYIIFPFDKKIHDSSQKVAGVEGAVYDAKPGEFEKIKEAISNKYSNWKELRRGDIFHSNGTPIGNDFYGKTSLPVLYANSLNSNLDGVVPVIIYFTEQHKLLFFIAEDGVL